MIQILNTAFGKVPNQPHQYPANLLNKWCNEFVLTNSQYDVIMLDTLGYYPCNHGKALDGKYG